MTVRQVYEATSDAAEIRGRSRFRTGSGPGTRSRIPGPPETTRQEAGVKATVSEPTDWPPVKKEVCSLLSR